VEASPVNVEALLAALRTFGEGYAKELSLADFDHSEGAIRIVEETEQCRIDIFTRIGGRRYADIIAEADVLTLGDQTLHYASRATLLGWKESSVREKDRLDAIALRRLQIDPKAFD
jgi:hypothetical protein